MTGSDWHVSGSYIEACNCEAICPCRRIGGEAGGRSTYGVCFGALSWSIDEGSAPGCDLSGLAVVLSCRYDDDEEGSPWTYVLYIDERADAGQRDALENIFCGNWGGPAQTNFPWAWKESRLLAVRSAPIEVEHRSSRGWFRVKDEVSVRLGSPVEEDTTVSCVIPGHERPGTEHYAERLALDNDVISSELTGKCAFSSSFAYSAG